MACCGPKYLKPPFVYCADGTKVECLDGTLVDCYDEDNILCEED